jgi:hypothetical protein
LILTSLLQFGNLTLLQWLLVCIAPNVVNKRRKEAIPKTKQRRLRAISPLIVDQNIISAPKIQIIFGQR